MRISKTMDLSRKRLSTARRASKNFLLANFNPCIIILIAISLLISFFFLGNAKASVFEWEPRTRNQFGNEHSHFVYPIVIDLPGVGVSSGIGTTILNANESDVDFTGFVLRGDFDVTGGTFLNYHLLKNRLLFDVGFYHFEAAVTQFRRGIDSSSNDFIIPRFRGKFAESQLTWTFNQRHLETFIHVLSGTQQTTQILDSNEHPYPVADDSSSNEQISTLGLRIDNSNDLLHPRKGYRFDLALKIPKNSDPLHSSYVVSDYNATWYIPMRKRDVLAFNIFRSDAHVTNEVKEDFASLRQSRGLNCAPSDTACIQTETDYINQLIAQNQYGTATSLGGLQRLRSYPNARYYAGHSMSYGMEYRLSFNNVKNPFNYYIAKGVKTGLQIAFFAEQGSVAERSKELFDNIKSSYGVGFRLILTGVVLRADYANGSDGEEFTVFFDYPWKLDYSGAS